MSTGWWIIDAQTPVSVQMYFHKIEATSQGNPFANPNLITYILLFCCHVMHAIIIGLHITGAEFNACIIEFEMLAKLF